MRTRSAPSRDMALKTPVFRAACFAGPDLANLLEAIRYGPITLRDGCGDPAAFLKAGDGDAAM